MSANEDKFESLERAQINTQHSNEKLRDEINFLKSKSSEMDESIEVIKEKARLMTEKTLSLEARHSELRKRIEDFNTNSKKQAERELQDLIDFENKLRNLTNSLTMLSTQDLSAMKYEENISDSEEQAKRVSKITEEMKKVEESFNILKENISSQDCEHQISPEERKTVLDMFQQERIGLINLVETLGKQKTQLIEQLKSSSLYPE